MSDAASSRAIPMFGEPQRMRAIREFSVARLRLNPCAGGASIPPPPAHARASQHGRNVMAKGQMRSNKEKKKPKAEWNKKKKGGPALSPFALAREQPQPGQNPFAKKS
jgi:hypothetical protein